MDFSLSALLNGIKQAFYDALDWLVGQLVLFLDYLFNLFVDLVNFLIAAVAFGIDLVVSLLPVDSACEFPVIPDVPVTGIINFINWILPVEAMACILGAVCLSYFLYFTVGRILKFLQVL